MNNEFKVNSYDNLKTAEEIILSTVSELRQELENCNSKLKSLFGESTFYGPIANHVEESLNIIRTATENNINSLNDMASSINKIANNYQATDNKVSKELGGL